MHESHVRYRNRLVPRFRDDYHGNCVWQQKLEDGNYLKIVHPGRSGDTPVFVGKGRRWKIVDRLQWPASGSTE
jgi:hypothetical protein